ncbi:MAG: hypothetical protein AABX83_01350 [Nanoarchaeota archaeon]
MKNKNQKKKELKKLKIIAWYELFASLTVHLLIFISIVKTKFIFIPLNFFLAVLGIFAGFLLLKNKRIGFYLSLIWAFLQIFIIKIGDTALFNFSQLIYFTLPYIKIIELENKPDVTFLPNVVGIVLFILLIIFRKELRK